jgi:hypothetical protein
MQTDGPNPRNVPLLSSSFIDVETSPIYDAVRRAVEPYEDAILTPDDADALASDVLAILEEQA